MKKTIIYLCACALWGMMVATSCSDNLESSVANSDTRSVIIDKNIFAVKGCINVKLAKTTTRALSSAVDGNVSMQSVPSAMSKAMSFSGAYKMERVFKPAGIYEARTVAEGLDRWYTIYFDESKDVDAVLQQFNKVGGVECAERVLAAKHPRNRAVAFLTTRFCLNSGIITTMARLVPMLKVGPIAMLNLLGKNTQQAKAM